MSQVVCKGTCTKYLTTKPHKQGRYEAGQKRCSTCDVFLIWEGKHCPCCGLVIRTKPKGTQTRYRLMIIQKVRRI